MSTREQDIRLEILNTLLTTPHRELGKIWPVHREMVEAGPAVLRPPGGLVQRPRRRARPQGDVHRQPRASATSPATATSAWPCCAACRRTRSCASSISSTAARRREKVPIAAKTKRREKAAKALGTAKAEQPAADAARDAVPAEPQFETKVEEFGLFRNVPRSVKTEVARYLREREADPDWFDSTRARRPQGAQAAVRPAARRAGRAGPEDPVREGPAGRQPAARAARAGQGRKPGRAGPRDRRAPHSVPRGRDGRPADDADGAARADRADEPAGADQQPRRAQAPRRAGQLRTSRR